METKRLILAIALSIVAITIYQMIFVPTPPPAPPQTTITQEKGETPVIPQQADASKRDTSLSFEDKAVKKPVEEEAIQPVTEDLKSQEEQVVVVETDLFVAKFMNRGAALKSFVLKHYKDDEGNLLELISDTVEDYKLYPFHFPVMESRPLLKEMNDSKFVYTGTLESRLSGNQKKEITFKYSDSQRNLYAVKKFVITNNSYLMNVDIQLNKDGKRVEAPVIFGPDIENRRDPQRAASTNLQLSGYDGYEKKSTQLSEIKFPKDKNWEVQTKRENLSNNFKWVAFETIYFAAVFKTSGKVDYMLQREKIKTDNQAEADEEEIKTYLYLVMDDTSCVFLGPKSEEVLEGILDEFSAVDQLIDYGWKPFGIIAKVLIKGVNFIHAFVPNYGWALVIFTVLLKILLFPLTYASSVSMAKMQTLQPKIKAIKKKYKNLRDPEQRKQMNMETMALYKQEKINPAGGCLPMLLQLPILIGFFQLLRITIDVRHAEWFLWINDLSLKDQYFVLPVLMGVTQLIVTKMSPTSGDPSQKKLMYIFPVVMVIFFHSFPSGLFLYWNVSNVLQIGQQYIINKKIFQEKKRGRETEKISQKKKRG